MTNSKKNPSLPLRRIDAATIRNPYRCCGNRKDKQDLAAFNLGKALIKADVSALPEDCLCVREKWREKRAVEKDGVIDSFADHTLAILRDQIAPLMQWRDTGGKEIAYRFDLLIARLQQTKLSGSAEFENHRDFLISWISALPINVKQVEEKLPLINKARNFPFMRMVPLK